MIDRYTKLALTAIAIGLLLNFFKDEVSPSHAQQLPCGTSLQPCYISLGDQTLSVRVVDKISVFETKTP
ncbi:hypothetical protein [Rhizobium rhizogenes]|uniref:Uncharacterized protein n=1 Tax=Rhizobium rhizogenes (strain K84 / ATCC BAA-868) TaxID=311403 RepID=B9JAV4_RHIR8|nr:hypothetical protein [Rhizobium rhizogenes]ACM25787.1 hypothetical protein Arad_1321 [Rhizobium rhizogenes K84]NTG06483.1 hypothetical protein [Rhizobium rhizogenes]